MPITANSAATVLMIPITEQFDIYEVFLTYEQNPGRAMITVLTMVRAAGKLEADRLAFALLSRKWKSNEFRKSKVIYVQTSYHARKIE